MSAHVVHILRIPVLIVLLGSMRPSFEAMASAISRLDIGAMWQPWAMVTAVGLAFVAVCLFDRSRQHLRTVLLVEAVVAAFLALPKFQLIMWIPALQDVGGTVSLSTLNDFTWALAITWLATALMTLARQIRARTAADTVETMPG